MISRSLPRPLLRVLPHPVLSVLLLLVWLLLVDSFAIGHWLLGAFLGVCIPLLTNRLLVGRSQEWHPLLLLKLLVLVMVGHPRRQHPGRPPDPRTDRALASGLRRGADRAGERPRHQRAGEHRLADPGSVSSDLSDDRKTLLVHGLDVPDKAALIAEIKQRYEAPLKEIFPCSLT
ncbi:monovalent cation/H+ antiporter subunit E [Pseudomonas aeruginosa]|nr:monovalent cation/H+ antiporter subunit E [Pseudomonas aeruginosa]